MLVRWLQNGGRDTSWRRLVSPIYAHNPSHLAYGYPCNLAYVPLWNTCSHSVRSRQGIDRSSLVVEVLAEGVVGDKSSPDLAHAPDAPVHAQADDVHPQVAPAHDDHSRKSLHSRARNHSRGPLHSIHRSRKALLGAGYRNMGHKVHQDWRTPASRGPLGSKGVRIEQMIFSWPWLKYRNPPYHLATRILRPDVPLELSIHPFRLEPLELTLSSQIRRPCRA